MILLLLGLLLNAHATDCGVMLRAPIIRSWRLGDGLKLRLNLGLPVRADAVATDRLAAHLPGIGNARFAEADVSLNIVQHDGPPSAARTGTSYLLSVPNGTPLDQDLVHVLYGVARRTWLERGLFPVHGACVGQTADQCTLIVGAAGSGKTTMTLKLLRAYGFKVFSGDKTLVRVSADGGLEALSGTRALTLRTADVRRWFPDQAVTLGDRAVFSLDPSSYLPARTVRITRIVQLQLNDGAFVFDELTPASALHTLLPLFTDKAREDVLFANNNGLLDGAMDPAGRGRLARELKGALEKVPTIRAVGSLDDLARSLRGGPHVRGTKKILVGICGIGAGHSHRQMPVLRHLVAQGHSVVIFAYGESLEIMKRKFGDEPRVQVVEVANPFLPGTAGDGLDFAAAARDPRNQVDFQMINARAMAEARRILGTPDLVISDYEQVSAQYAYSQRARFVTLDQQSKFLLLDYPLDEVERLNMFFPTATRRFAVSFFPVEQKSLRADVLLLPAMVRDEVRAMKGHARSARRSLLVYISAQPGDQTGLGHSLDLLTHELPKDVDAQVHLPRRYPLPPNTEHVFFHHHGSPLFDKHLAESWGILSTAGHTLLSEAMFLRKPVYALPLAIDEQRLNASAIAERGFGMSGPRLSARSLRDFLDRLGEFQEALGKDKTILTDGPGNARVIEEIDSLLD